MRSELSAAQHTIDNHQLLQMTAEERMKQAFMRGVCALNREALSVFKDESLLSATVLPLQPSPPPPPSVNPPPVNPYRDMGGSQAPITTAPSTISPSQPTPSAPPATPPPEQDPSLHGSLSLSSSLHTPTSRPPLQTLPTNATSQPSQHKVITTYGPLTQPAITQPVVVPAVRRSSTHMRKISKQSGIKLCRCDVM